VSWNDLSYLGLRVVPWDGTRPKCAWRRSLFSASLTSTLRLLRDELRHLSAKQVLVELDVWERDIRLDGYPRANAKVHSPVVAVSFQSQHGPLRYVCAEYDDWRDNLRAIALSLQALRAVDRYGVSKRGEQYRGWKELPVSTDPAAHMDADQARAYLADAWGGDVRRALFETHPDHGGDPDEFRKVQRARELVGGST